MAEANDTLISSVELQQETLPQDDISVPTQPDPYKLEAFDISTVPEKFIDKDTGVVKLNDILKSNSELEKTLHARAPETYNFTDVFEEQKLVWESEEQEQEVTGLFKKHRISNEAASEILRMYGSRLNNVMEMFGTPYDQEAELTKLETDWGSNTQARLQEVADYMYENKLPAEVFSTSPLKTAAGMKLLWQMIKNTQGPSVMRTDEMPVADLETQLSETINNPLYYIQNAEGDKVRKKAAELSQRISKRR